MTSKRTRTRIAIAFAAMLGSTAHAGIEAWTTTGPRGAWDVIGGDACRPAATIVGAVDRWARTTDAGKHWQPLAMPPGQTFGWSDTDPSRYFTPLAISADRLGSGALYLATSSGSLQKSTNGGAGWSRLPSSVPTDGVGYVFVPWGYTAHISRLIADGDRLLIAYGTRGGLLRSVDAGATVSTITPAGQAVLDVDARGSRLIAVGLTVNAFPSQPYAWRSDDSGTTWLSNPFAFPAGSVPVRLAWGSAERVVALVGEYSDTTYWTLHVWLSDDGGATFAPNGVTFPGYGLPYVGERDPLGPSLRSDGCESSRLFMRVGGTGYVSEDAGSTWRALDVGDGVVSGAWTPAAYGGPPSLTLTTERSGVLRSDDAGVTFVPFNRGLPGAPMTTLGTATYAGERYLVANASFRWNLGGGFYDRFGYDLLRRGGEGNLWTIATPAQSGGPTFATVPGEPGTLLAYSRFNAQVGSGFRSDDAGATWITYGALPPGLTERVGGGAEASGKYFAYGTYLVFNNRPGSFFPARYARSDDLGQTWIASPEEYVNTTALAAAAANPARVYAGRDVFQASANGGMTWASTSTPAELAGPFAPVDAIAVDPVNHLHVLVAGRYGNQVFESYDGGAHWTRLGTALPGTQGLALTVDWARTPRMVYAGTDDGLFTLTGAGASGASPWTRVGASNGMRVAQILLEGPATMQTITVATDRGVFELTSDPTAATLPVFRFYNTQTNTHFYTASVAERDHVIATYPQFVPEGTAFHAVDAARTDVGTPVWRFFNTSTGTHFYTASADERAFVIATYPQFVDEGVVYRALPGTEPGTVKLFRFFNSATGAHFYTTQDDERAVVNQLLPTYADEGVVFAVYPAVPAP